MMGRIEVVNIANSLDVRLVPLKNVGGGYVGPHMPIGEEVEIDNPQN